MLYFFKHVRSSGKRKLDAKPVKCNFFSTTVSSRLYSKNNLKETNHRYLKKTYLFDRFLLCCKRSWRKKSTIWKILYESYILPQYFFIASESYYIHIFFNFSNLFKRSYSQNLRETFSTFHHSSRICIWSCLLDLRHIISFLLISRHPIPRLSSTQSKFYF